MTDDDVFMIVKNAVGANQPNDYQLDVLKKGMRHSGNWWYIVVQPNKDDVRSFEYSNLMAKIERDIETQHDLNVLLVPVTPD